jgi:hypothetical protein
VKLTTHLRLVPRSRMRGAVPPLPQYAFVAWCSIKAQGQLYLTIGRQTKFHTNILLPLNGSCSDS